VCGRAFAVVNFAKLVEVLEANESDLKERRY